MYDLYRNIFKFLVVPYLLKITLAIYLQSYNFVRSFSPDFKRKSSFLRYEVAIKWLLNVTHPPKRPAPPSSPSSSNNRNTPGKFARPTVPRATRNRIRPPRPRTTPEPNSFALCYRLKTRTHVRKYVRRSGAPTFVSDVCGAGPPGLPAPRSSVAPRSTRSEFPGREEEPCGTERHRFPITRIVGGHAILRPWFWFAITWICVTELLDDRA